MSPSHASLYDRLLRALDGALAAPASDLQPSGFVDPAQQADPGAWQPMGELPEHLFDRRTIADAAKFCVFDGRAYVGVRGGAFTEFERRKRAGTTQFLTLILNGSQAIEASYPYDGRGGWSCFPVDIPSELGAVRAIEIERDGALLLSRKVGEDPAARDYRATVWLINAAGRLSGAVNDAASDVVVEMRIDGVPGWAITNAPAETGRPRPFEFDLASRCTDGRLVKLSVLNPASGSEAARSPLGVFASDGAHFLFARPRIADGKCRAVLLHWKGGKRARLTLAHARDMTLDEVARVDLDDPPEARFEGGDNSFALDLDLLRAGNVAILDEDGSMLGKLPPLDQIMAFAGREAAPPDLSTPQNMSAWAREAAVEERWDEALERWAACIAKFGAKPHWLNNRARALVTMARPREAEREFAQLAELFPDLPDGLIGLARLAQERKDWAGAASLWTCCIERFSDQRVPQWTAAKAGALRNLGRFAEAEQLLVGLAGRNPEDFAKARIRAAIDHAHHAGQSSARREEISAEIETHFPGDAGIGQLIDGMGLFARLGDHERARSRLLKAVPLVSTAEEIEVLFRATGELVETGSRGPLWEQLLAAARATSTELELRLLLALERFRAFERRFDEARDALMRNDNAVLLERVRARLAKPRGDVFREPKIFGIGLSRTGTQSLTEALGILDMDTAHWTNPLTYQLIGPADIHLFGACTDISVAQDFEKLYYQYPNARFVWTQRPLDAWIASITRHYEFWHRASGIEGLRRELEGRTVPFGLSRAAIEFGLYLNEPDFSAAYRAYERRVRGFFRDKPEGRLLELDVFAGQGWDALCRFLGCAAPDRPFPHANKGFK